MGWGIAKAALVDDGPVQRGQQYKHYKGRSPKAPALEDGTGILLAALLGEHFSGSCTVTSRNSLIHNGATNGTKSERFDHKGG